VSEWVSEWESHMRLSRQQRSRRLTQRVQSGTSDGGGASAVQQELVDVDQLGLPVAQAHQPTHRRRRPNPASWPCPRPPSE